MKTYYSLLDPLRFFAAFWVMNFHYFLGLGLSNDIHWYRYGNLGVQLFFIVSGFVIVQSLYGKNLREFAIGRFIRLFPLFWILCTLTFLLTLIIPHTEHVNIIEYFRSMTMLGDVFDGITYGRLIDPSYWTLTVELLFYTGIGIFTYFFSYKNIRYFLASWFAISILAFSLHIDENFYVKLLLVRHASYFIFGSSLALIAMKQAENIFEKYFDLLLIFVSATYAIYINGRAIPAYITPHPLDAVIVTVLNVIFFISVPLLVYLSHYVKNPRIIHLFVILGGVTYPLYLLHQRIGNVLINYGIGILNIPWNIFALNFEVFIIISAYFVYVWDKKMRFWLKKKMESS